MRRGTTPTHIFTTDIDLTSAELIYVTYQQPRCKSGEMKTIVEKTLEDLEVTEDEIRLQLTQDETLAFRENVPVSIQIRAKFPDAAAVACQVITVGAEVILKEGAI